jgi:hypothetical protein
VLILETLNKNNINFVKNVHITLSQLALGCLKVCRHTEVLEHSKQGKHLSLPSLYGYQSGDWLAWFVKVRGERGSRPRFPAA